MSERQCTASWQEWWTGWNFEGPFIGTKVFLLRVNQYLRPNSEGILIRKALQTPLFVCPETAMNREIQFPFCLIMVARTYSDT